MFRRILVAHDGSTGGARAFVEALELARRLEIDLHMVCVKEIPKFASMISEVDEAEREADRLFQKSIDAARAQAEAVHVNFEAHVIIGHPVSAICDLVRADRFDLLVIGDLGRSEFYKWFFGSTTDRLVSHAPCKVLVVKCPLQ